MGMAGTSGAPLSLLRHSRFQRRAGHGGPAADGPRAGGRAIGSMAAGLAWPRSCSMTWCSPTLTDVPAGWAASGTPMCRSGSTMKNSDSARPSMRCRGTWAGSTTCMGCQHVRKHVSERDLNHHGRDLRLCSPGRTGGRITAGQRVGCVSEDRLHQKANILWRASSHWTVPGERRCMSG